MLKINNKLSVGFKARFATFLLFLSTLSIPGSHSVALSGQEYSFQIYAKGIMICIPLILFPFNNYFKEDQLRNNILLLFFGIYGIFTSLWSPMPGYTFARSASFVIFIISISCIFFAYMTAYEDFSSKLLYDLLLITGFIVWSFAVIGVLHLGIGWRKIYLSSTILNRLGGDILPPNTLGAVAAIHLILAFKSGFKNKLVNSFSIFAACYVIIQSNSRSAIISLVASGLIIFFILSFFMNDLKRVGFIFLMIAAFSGSLFFIDSRSIKTEAINISRYNDMEEYTTLTGRTYIWNKILSQPKLALIGGNGFGVISDKGFVILNSLTTVNAHNGFLQIIAGTGIIGFSSFVLYISQLIGYAKNLIHKGFWETGCHKLIWTILYLQVFVLMNNFTESNFGSQIVPQLIVFVLSAMILMDKSNMSYFLSFQVK